MLISHKHRFIFIKTQKTAGTSIEIALSKFLGEDDVITPISASDEAIRSQVGAPGPQNYALPLSEYELIDWARLVHHRRRPRKYWNHISARAVQERLGPQKWASYFKFCVERNPLDKAVSYYHWQVGNGGFRGAFRDFVLQGHAYKVSDFDCYTISGTLAVDRVLCFENLQKELQCVTDRLGLPGSVLLPKAKGNFRKDRRPSEELYDDSMIEVIRIEFAREIALLGFPL